MVARRSAWRGVGTGAAAWVASSLAVGCAPEIGPEGEGPRAEVARDVTASPVRRIPVAPESAASEGAAVPEEEEGSFTMVSIRTGAELEIELIDPIIAGERRPGDRFRAGVVRPLIENDMILVPLNSLVEGEITALEVSREGGEALLKVRFVDVFFNGRAWPMAASVVAVGAAGLGGLATEGQPEPILGRVIGGGRRGVVAGAAAGVAPGTAILLAAEEGGGAEPGLRAGAILRLRLDEPLVIGLPDV